MGVLDFFNVCDLEASSEILGALAIALVAPLIPFASTIVLPGGTRIAMSRERSEELTAIFKPGLQQSQASLSGLDLAAVLDTLWEEHE